jgi:DNA-binding transcriptional LysR family regulator
MLQIDHLRTWLAVVDTRSFRGASRRLGLAQPTVSQHVRKLEATLGAALIERIGCVLTGAGQRLRPCAEALLRLEQRARQLVREPRLAMGASSNTGTYLLLPHVHRFEQLHAPTRIDLRIGPNPQVRQQLLDGEIDLALLEWWQDHAGLVAVPWCQQRLVLIVAPTHPWAGRRSIALAAVAGETLVGGEPGTGTGRLLTEALGASFTPRAMRRLDSTEAVKRAVAASLGVSLVLESAVEEEVRAGKLAVVPLRGRPLYKTIHLAHQADLPEHAPARRIVELMLARAPGGAIRRPRLRPPGRR